MMVHEAQARLLEQRPALVLFEDARKRQWFGNRDRNIERYGAGAREGAGAAKRDAKVWEDFLRSARIPYIAGYPRRKVKAEGFAQITGYTGRTNQHGRDAALMVAGLNAQMVLGLIQQYEQNLVTAAQQAELKRAARNERSRARRRAVSLPV